MFYYLIITSNDEIIPIKSKSPIRNKEKAKELVNKPVCFCSYTSFSVYYLRKILNYFKKHLTKI